jgi:hypothetical protein
MWTRTVLIVPALLTTGCASLLSPVGPYPRYGRLNPYAMRAPVMAPLPVGRWDNVIRTPLNSAIDVVATDGLHAGVIEGADVQEIVLREGGQQIRIARANIMRIDLVDMAGSETAAVAAGAAKGAILGAGAAALVGAVFGGPAWPPSGPFLRGAVAIGGVAGGAAAMEQRRQRMIYLAPSMAPGRSPYGGYSPDDPFMQPEVSAGGERYPGAFALPACATAPSIGGVRQITPPNVVQSPGMRRINAGAPLRRW